MDEEQEENDDENDYYDDEEEEEIVLTGPNPISAPSAKIDKKIEEDK